MIFLTDLESIQHELSSDYSLNTCFSHRFPYIDGPSFSPYKPLQNVHYSKSVTCSFFFRNSTHIVTRTQRNTPLSALRSIADKEFLRVVSQCAYSLI